MDILTYINKMNRLYGSESQVAGIGTGAVIPEEFDELSPREQQYYQQGPFSTHPDFLAAQGGRIGFKHGGSWADWMSNHSEQMTFEEYLQMDMDKPVHPVDKSTGGRVYDTRKYFKPGGLVEPGVMNYGKPQRLHRDIEITKEGYKNFVKNLYDQNADYTAIKYLRKKFKNKTNISGDQLVAGMDQVLRDNFKESYRSQLFMEKNKSWLKKNNYISENELAKLLNLDPDEAGTSAIRHKRSHKLYQALDPIQSYAGKGGSQAYFYKRPNAKQIAKLSTLHPGSGGGQGGLRSFTIENIQKLHKDRIFTRFLKNWDGKSDIPDNIIKKIFGKDSAYTAHTVMNYGRALEGKEAIEGIGKDKELAKKIRAGIKYQMKGSGPAIGSWHTAARTYVIKELDAIYNPKKTPGKNWFTRVDDIRKVLDKYGLGKLQVNEIQALRTGLSGGTEPYSIFSDLLTKKMNEKVKGNIFDPQTSKRQIRLNAAIEEFGKNSDEAATIIKEQDEFVKAFREMHPEFKNVNLTRFDFRNPIEVM